MKTFICLIITGIIMLTGTIRATATDSLGNVTTEDLLVSIPPTEIVNASDVFSWELSGGAAFSGTLLWTLDNPNPYGTSQSDSFGISIDVSDTYVIVGAYLEDEAAGDGSGKAYIYNPATGALLHTLNNPNAYSTVVDDRFGNAVAISDTHAIVGAPREDAAAGSGAGKAYIYNAVTGALLWTLDNPDPTPASGNFGISVGISDTYAIVGANDNISFGNGAAYVYELATGNLVWTLLNSDPSSGDDFGVSVSISDDYAVVGARLDLAGAGKVFVYDLLTGGLYWPISGLANSGNLGTSVAVSSTNILVAGEPGVTEAGIYSTSGRIQLYNLNTGEWIREITNPNAYSTPSGDRFGYSSGISDNYIIVGAYDEDEAAGSNSGKVYIFDLLTSTPVWTLDNPNPFGTVVDDRFGIRVAMSNTYAVVSGSLEDDAGGTSSGKVYIYN